MKNYCIAMSMVLLIGGMVTSALCIDMPNFMSGTGTTIGIDADFNGIYSKANAIYDVIEHDDQHIIWKFAESPRDWVFINKDGILVIASTAEMDLSVKDRYKNELVDVISTIEQAGGTVSVNQPVAYYSGESNVYRVITHDFSSNFEYYLSIPNCTINQARLSISGSDWANYCNDPDNNGQHYYIDGKEVSGCKIIDRDFSKVPSGISCGEYHSNTLSCSDNWVTVNPVDISSYIVPGLHTISSKSISSKHTLTIEIVSTESEKPVVLYNKDKTIWVEDTKSQSLAELYSLILPNPAENNMTSQEEAIE